MKKKDELRKIVSVVFEYKLFVGIIGIMSSILYGNGYTYSGQTITNTEIIPEKICSQCNGDVENNIGMMTGTVELYIKDSAEILILKKNTRHNVVRCENCGMNHVRYGTVITRHDIEFFDGTQRNSE